MVQVPCAAVLDISRYLSIRSSLMGRLTADGDRLAFISNITGVPQAWAMPAGGGWPDQLTFADQRVAGIAASPVEPLLVFSRDDGGNERMQIHAVDPLGGTERNLVVNPEVIHRFGAFSEDGARFAFCDNRRNGVDFDLFVYSMSGGERAVTEMPGWNTVVAVRGHKALVGHFVSNVQSEAWLVDLEDGRIDRVTPPGEKALNSPVDLGPGGSVFVVSDRSGEFRRAHRIDGEEWVGFGPEADVDVLEVGDSVGLLGWNEEGRTRLAWFDLTSLEMGDEIEIPLGVVPDAHVDSRAAAALVTVSGPAHPSDVWRVPAGHTAPERLTRSSTAGLDPGEFVVPDLVRIESFDGLEVPAWVYRPAGEGTPPVVVSVHGGPEAQERVGFNPVYQYLLAAGFAVVAPNVRGSSGYGRTYQSLDDRERRMDSVADLVEVGRWVRSQADLDGDRMAVMGGSYGGFMVLAALTTAPELWAAGVDIVGIANFVTFLENTGSYRRALREAEYGSLETDRGLLESISPIHMVARIAAPLLVIHGRNDPRVPLGEAEQIAREVSQRGGVVELMVFDDEGHGIVKLANRKVAYGRIAEFLTEVLALPAAP